MSRKQFVSYRENGFWAYDVALGVFLKYLIDAAESFIDAAESRGTVSDRVWLIEAVAWWRVVATVSDFGLTIDDDWTPAQVKVFRDLAVYVCDLLRKRESIPANEIETWKILDDLHLFTRGAAEVFTAPVVEMGHAIISIIDGSMPADPEGIIWMYGVPEGKRPLHQREC